MPTPTAPEQFWLDYIQSRYPAWIRQAQLDDTSMAWKYDYKNVFVVNMLNALIEKGSEQITIAKADEFGLAEWENFLGLPSWEDKTLAVRRGIIRAKLGLKFATVANLKAIIRSFLPEWTNFNIVEYRRDAWVVTADLFKYSVLVPEGSLSSEDYDAMIELLQQIQPAHCELILMELVEIADSIGMTEGITYTRLHYYWTRGDEYTEQPKIWVKSIRPEHTAFYDGTPNEIHWALEWVTPERNFISLLDEWHVDYGTDAGLTCFDLQALCFRIDIGEMIWDSAWLSSYDGSLSVKIKGDWKIVVELWGTGSMRYTTNLAIVENAENSIVVRLNNALDKDIARVSGDCDIFVNWVKATNTTVGIANDTVINNNLYIGSEDGTTDNSTFVDKLNLLEFALFDTLISDARVDEWHDNNPRENVYRWDANNVFSWNIWTDLSS
jgi:hypothetical protein